MKLYCGIDLHSNNGVYIVADEAGKKLYHRRLPNDLRSVLVQLEPFRESLETVAVESTFNWYWRVDGLNAGDFPVRLANPASIDESDLACGRK